MKPQKTKLSRGVAVGSAALVAAAVGHSTGHDVAPIVTTLESGRSAGRDEISGVEEGQADNGRLSIELAIDDPSKWTNIDAKRFKALAMKRAAEIATEEENVEFTRLQHRRRISESNVTGDDIMKEWQRRRLVGQLIDVFSRNVTFFRPEDQQRIRALSEAQRA